MTEREQHWDAVYRSKAADEVSWFSPSLDVSLQLFDMLALPRSARIIDVGGGASTLVDDLLARGFSDLTVLDIAASALELSQRRLGARAKSVQWIAADITEIELPVDSVDVWHDRAVFHFLTKPEARRRYLAQVRRALVVGGHVIIATFGPTGPERCSGLEVVRYDAAGLHAEFGAESIGPSGPTGFALVHAVEQVHRTPQGREQAFVYALLRRLG